MDRRQPTSFIHLLLISMWSYVSTWRATVDDGRGNNADVFPMRYRRQKGSISSDRGGGSLSNAWSVQPTTWDASPVGGGLLPQAPVYQAPVYHTPPVDVVSCTLTTLHEQITFSKKQCGDRSRPCTSLSYSIQKIDTIQMLHSDVGIHTPQRPRQRDSTAGISHYT